MMTFFDVLQAALIFLKVVLELHAQRDSWPRRNLLPETSGVWRGV